VKCVECRKEIEKNLGSEKNPLCEECFKKMEAEYSISGPTPQKDDKWSVNDGFAPCPKCRHKNAIEVKFTWWGGIIGPKMFNVVKCLECGTQFNGDKGKLLNDVIIIYLIIIIGAFATLLWFLTTYAGLRF
jgi:hypothetical protein